MLSCGCKAFHHETNHANPDHRLAMIQTHLIVAAQPPRLVKPAKGSLYNPAFGKDREAFDVLTSPYNLQPKFAKGTKLLNPLDQFAQIAAVGPNDLQSPKQSYHGFDQALGGNAILYVGWGDQDRQNQSQAVDSQVPFAPRHLFARIEPRSPA